VSSKLVFDYSSNRTLIFFTPCPATTRPLLIISRWMKNKKKTKLSETYCLKVLNIKKPRPSVREWINCQGEWETFLVCQANYNFLSVNFFFTFLMIFKLTYKYCLATLRYVLIYPSGLYFDIFSFSRENLFFKLNFFKILIRMNLLILTLPWVSLDNITFAFVLYFSTKKSSSL